jgi:preprotein translocase subunit SecG
MVISLSMNILLAVIQIILSVVLIAAILLQNSESGLGAAFGGDDGGVKTTRRGAEKVMFQGTIILAIVFVVISFVVFVIS